jgi:hypothetical protein
MKIHLYMTQEDIKRYQEGKEAEAYTKKGEMVTAGWNNQEVYHVEVDVRDVLSWSKENSHVVWLQRS